MATIKSLIAADAKPETICVVARTHYELAEYQKHLLSIFPRAHEIEPGKADDSAKPGLRLATIHRVKGLEFDHVILAGAQDHAEVANDKSEETMQKRTLVYVAATRARKSLFVCHVTPG
jgi:superfamily I DNA/RNA helicase